MPERVPFDQPSADLTHDTPLHDYPPNHPSTTSSSVALSKSKNRVSVVTAGWKPAPVPQPLAALTRWFTRPSRPFSGCSSSAGLSPPGVIEVNDDNTDNEEMDMHVSLKRKQEISRKKSGPKKGKS